MKHIAIAHRTRAHPGPVSAGVLLSIAVPALAATPVEVARLVAKDSASNDFFGFSIALSGDTAVIGALRDDDNGPDSGAVHVFTRFEDDWRHRVKLTAADGAPGDVFGISVAISDETVLVGADLADEKGSDSGAAYVFGRSENT